MRQLTAACSRSRGRHLHLHQLFRFGEGSGRNFGTDGGRGSKRGRSARGGLLAGRSLRRGGFESGAQHSQRTVGDEFSARSRHWIVPFPASRFLSSEVPQKHTSGAKARVDIASLIPGMNPRPTAPKTFSASSEVAPFQNAVASSYAGQDSNARPHPAAHAPQDSA